MPAKSGASHALAAFLSIILGSILSNFLSAHTGIITGLSEGLGGVLAALIGTSLPADVTGLLVISTALAFCWGLAYHYARHGTNQQSTRPNNYVTGNHPFNKTDGMSRQEPAADTTEDADRESDYSYQTSREARWAAEQLHTRLERDLDEVKSRLDDAHDRLYDADESEMAGNVRDVLDDIVTLERTLGDAPISSSSEREDDRGLDRSHELADAHAKVCNTAENVVEAVREFHREAPDVEGAAVTECGTLLADLETVVDEYWTLLERTLDDRGNVLKQDGDTR